MPDKDNYRRYRIRTVEGQDDFASMAEVVRRRYSRVLGSIAETGNRKPESNEEAVALSAAEFSQESPVEIAERLTVKGVRNPRSAIRNCSPSACRI